MIYLSRVPSICVYLCVNFVLLFRSSKSLFKVSIKTVIALSMGMDGYKLVTLNTKFEKYIKEEEKFLIDMFVENGYNKQLLKNLVMQYNNKKNNKNNRKNNTENRD